MDKAKSAASKNAAQAEPDSELGKLIDKNEEGYIFRKDLPFPPNLEVKITRTHEISGRFFEESAIDKSNQILKGTQSTIFKLERSGDQISYKLEESIFTESLTEEASKDKTKKPVVRQLAEPGPARIFKKTGETWKADNSEGFRAVALSQQLAPHFTNLLIEHALTPRALWFGKKRLKIGDKVPIKNATLPMVFSGKATGDLAMVFESIDTVAGHPCGVFSVSGNFSRKDFADFEGNFIDDDVTIESGKLWLSLLHPIVLKEELATIQSYKSGGQGGPVGRGQGTIKVSVIREWKAKN